MTNIAYSIATTELLDKLQTTVDAVNAARKDCRWTDVELFENNVKTLVKDANSAVIKDASKAFVAIFENSGSASFVEAYFKDWFCPKYAVSDDENGIMTITANGNSQRILLSHIDKVSKHKITAQGDWRDWLAIYVDNVAKGKSANAKGENAIFTKTALPSHLVEKRDKGEKFWRGSGSSDLCKQINALIRMMLPADFQPDFRLLSADQATVADSLYRDKDVHAMDGVHKSYVKTATAEALILRQVNTRIHDLSVDFVTGFKGKPERKNAPAKDDAKATAPVKGAAPAEKPVPTKNTVA